ncbi:MAG: FAD-dependent thymidylate synthase [Endomicrobiaceae bacterium]|nr:FAD-dependent thymidylate synthase [Endomicrobiaceae bacterium]
MLVKLLKWTKEPEKTCAIAGRLCYSSVGVEELDKKLDEHKIKDILIKIVKSGHLSVLEHASFTFAIEGVSRALLAQLTRHRIASFSVQSQRYVKFKNGIDCVVPPIIKKNKELLKEYQEFLKTSEKYYEKLLNAEIPAEDARYVLPNAASTKIVLTMNVRELRHFFALRCCNRAQWEIRDMSCRMLKLAKEIAPILFETAGPDCVSVGCTETMPCNNPWKKFK